MTQTLDVLGLPGDAPCCLRGCDAPAVLLLSALAPGPIVHLPLCAEHATKIANGITHLVGEK
jgi:hypothetical protein